MIFYQPPLFITNHVSKNVQFICHCVGGDVKHCSLTHICHLPLLTLYNQ